MTKRKRSTISTKTRFEVFKRDSFKCQYCGRCAPEIVLELEHIEPHSKGGSDDVLNLVTSCWECNNGKGDRRLDDNAVIEKQRTQLEDLQERREQLEMMLRWRQGNVDLTEQTIDAFVDAYNKRTPGWHLSGPGLESARKIVKTFGLARALDALDAAADRIVVLEGSKATKESVSKLMGVVFVMAEPPDVQRLYKIRARIRKRWNYVNDGRAIGVLRRLLTYGAAIDEIETRCDGFLETQYTSFNEWCAEMDGWVQELRGA
jgi:hypothetical protein